MEAYPLIFGFRELVAGNGFVAGVAIRGRALLKQEDDGSWWVFGVEPGGISDFGVTEQEAYQNFRQSFREVLYDSAALAADFEALKSDVEQLCGQVNEVWAREWQAARDAIRSGALCPEGALVSSLSRYTKDVTGRVEVVCLSAAGHEISPTDNSSEEPLRTAA